MFDMNTNYIKNHISFILGVFLLLSFFSFHRGYAQGTLSGELRKWHTITLLFDGPMTSENATVNPFTDYRLNVLFTAPNGEEFLVPGFYAADGDAAETSASAGNKWAVRFKPNATGNWSYVASFRTGVDVAASLEVNAGSSTSFDGATGTFSVTGTNKTAPDNRANGRLNYVGERFLRFEETNKVFLKVGADSPETMLAYDDFDNTPNSNKDWSAHNGDWTTGDPVWQGDKGKGLIGAINYLADKGMNAFSFIAMDIDDPDLARGSSRSTLWPWAATSADDLDGSTPEEIDQRKRYDVSKLEQWEIVFNHGDTKGMYLHFKLQEDGNHMLIDNLTLGVERKIYYREFIARFGHHLALNWNLGEEFWIYNPTLINSFATYVKALDPYDHNIVIHCYPFEQDERLFRPMLGPDFELSGISIQAFVDSTHIKVKKWVQDSEASGKPWVVGFDEQAHWNRGVGVDADHGGPRGIVEDNRKEIRYKVLWSALMAGGAGVEYYFGRQTGQTDHSAQDWRSRESKWEDAKIALDFFETYLEFWEMDAYDELITGDEMLNFCLAKPNDTYVVYLTNGGEETLDLSAAEGNYTVKWFNPREGGALVNGSVLQLEGGAIRSLGTAPNDVNDDWAILVEKAPIPVTGITVNPTSLTLDEGATATLTHTISPANAGNVNVTWSSSNTAIASVDQNGEVTAIQEGTATISVLTEDGNFSATSIITVVKSAISVTAINITPESATLDEGESLRLTAEIVPTDATNVTVLWSSNNGSIATVSPTGVVTAIQEGTAIITGRTEDGDFIDTVLINVVKPIISVNGIAITPATLTLDEGESATLVAQVLPTNASNTNVSWSSSNSSVATVDEMGRVLAIVEGTATITTSTEDGDFTDTSVITVVKTAVFVNGVSLSPAMLSLEEGTTAILSAQVLPSNASNANVLWESSNTAVVTVDMNGEILAIREGVASIIVTTEDGGFSDVSEITVTPGPENIAPIALASASPLSGVVPLEVQFVGTGSTDDVEIVVYHWDFGDGSAASAANPIHMYTEAGRYTATLTVSDAEGLMDTDTIDIIVDPREEEAVISSFTLINADTNTALYELTDGMEIDMASIADLNVSIRVHTDPEEVGSAHIELGGPIEQSTTDNTAPYSLFGDIDGNYQGVPFLVGDYALKGTLYSDMNQGGILTTSVNLNFSVVDLSITEGQMNGVNLFPNPASTEVFLEILDPAIVVYGIGVYDLNGRTAKSFNVADVKQENGMYKIEVSGLTNGVYIVRLFSNAAAYFDYKLLIRN